MNKEFVDNVSKIFTTLNIRLERIIGNESVAGKRPMDYGATEQVIEGLKQSTKEYQRIQRQTDENFNRVFKAINVNIKNINGLRNIVFKSMDRKVESLDTISRENIAAQEYKDIGVEYDPRTERFHEIAGENKNRMVGEAEVRQRVADLRNNQIIEEQKPDAEKITEVSDNPILGNINSNLMTINEMLKTFLSNIAELLVRKEEEKVKPEDVEKPKLLHARKIRDEKKSSGFFDFIISALSLITIGYLPAIIDWFKSFDGDFMAMFNDIKKRFEPMVEKIIKQAGEIISESSEKIWRFLKPIISDIGELIWTPISTSIGDWLDEQKQTFGKYFVKPIVNEVLSYLPESIRKFAIDKSQGLKFAQDELSNKKSAATTTDLELARLTGGRLDQVGSKFDPKIQGSIKSIDQFKEMDIYKNADDNKKQQLLELVQQRLTQQEAVNASEFKVSRFTEADKLAEEYINWLQENSPFADRSIYSKEISGSADNPRVQIKARKDDGQEITENFILEPIGNQKHKLKMSSTEIDGKTNTSDFSKSKFSKFQDHQAMPKIDSKAGISTASEGQPRKIDPNTPSAVKRRGEQLNKESEESQNDDNSLLDFFKNLLKPIGNSLEIPNANQMPRQKAIIPKVIPNVQAPVDDVFWGVP